MDVVEVLLGAVGGLALGWTAGYALGARARAFRSWRYWVLNVVAVLIGGTLNAVGLNTGRVWLAAGAVAFIASSLSGLKYGRGITAGRRSLEAPPLREPEAPHLWDED